jgi:Tfp pilus assembly protein PilF
LTGHSKPGYSPDVAGHRHVQRSTGRGDALTLWVAGCRQHGRKRYARAIELYRQSIALCPTAEAHTWLAWAYSNTGRVEDAIGECHRAIEVDPTFGNPYNDIGAYLVSAGELADAEPWFALAKGAERYEPRHFPFVNLGRLFLARDELGRALEEFRGALEHRPRDGEALEEIEAIRKRMN